MNRHAEIAGAGFAGLTLAVALARHGWTVRVHERGTALRDDGAGIFLWENGIRVLTALGLEDALLARTYTAPQWEERLADGALLAVRPLPVAEDVRMVTLVRQDLYATLLSAAHDAGVDIRTGSYVVGADPAGALETSVGRRWPADLAVGADGINSRVRDGLGLLDEHQVHEDFRVCRFLTRLDLAPGAAGEWRSYVDHWDLKARRRVMYVPCNDDDLYLLLGAGRHDVALDAPIDPEPWCRSFPRLEPVLRTIPRVAHVAPYEAIRVRAWSAGVAAIVGDAAHAMPPTIGQGAGTAMGNAYALATALAQEPDVPAALHAWEREHRPVTDETQATSVGRLASLFPEPDHRRDAWGAEQVRVARRAPT